MKEITLITTLNGLGRLSDSSVGWLVQVPPERLEVNQQAAFSFEALTGDPELFRKEAVRFVREWLQGEPDFSGIQHLAVLEELFLEELFKQLSVLHLHDVLVEAGFQQCNFLTPSWWAEDLKRVSQLLRSSLIVRAPDTKVDSRVKRVWGRLKNASFSAESWASECSTILEYLDPYHYRSILQKTRTPSVTPGKTWFYSTAFNFTQIGLAYEPFFPEPFEFLVEDKRTGGKPLAERHRSFHFLYDWHSRNCIPTRSESEALLLQSHAFLSRQLPLTARSNLIQSLIIESPMMQNVMSRLLPIGLFQARVIRRWMEASQPAALVLGNLAFEGYALQLAKQAHIPTTLLQHGVFSDFYRYVDYPVDHVVARGQFFYERLSEQTQNRAYILNFPRKNSVGTEIEPKEYVVFVTAPFSLQASLGEVDIESVLKAVIEAVQLQQKKVVIRVHPLERVSEYEARVRRILGVKVLPDFILFSQGTCLDTLLKRASALVLFGSTVFLNGLEHRIPIINVDWVSFGMKRVLKEKDIFYFPETITMLKTHVTQACQGLLLPKAVEIDFFLEKTPVETLKSGLKNCLGKTV